MDYQEFYYNVQPIFIDQFHQCNFETPFSSPEEPPVFSNTAGDFTSDDFDIERLLQTETDLLDFDFIDQIEETTSTQETSLELRETNTEFPADGEECLTELLVAGAEAIEAENRALASVLINRLQNLLSGRENSENPLIRLAFFFTQALHYRNTTSVSQMAPDSVFRERNSVSAFQMLQELSPYVKFSHFTANQSILEATKGDEEVHVIDFDIMEGFQWPPLMVDLASKNSISLRITATLHNPEASRIIQHTGRRLKEFADSINLEFVFDHILIEKEEDFNGIKLGKNKNPVANCMINQLHMPQRDHTQIKTFLNGVTRLSPKIIALVQEELFDFSTTSSSMSFSGFFREVLRHYSSLSESLRSGLCGGYKLALRVIEEEFLGTRILESLTGFPLWRGERRFGGNGLCPPLLKGSYRSIPLSSSNVSQAKHLMSLFNGGYWVQHEDCRLALCWKSRPLITASIWVPLSL